jgi:DNA-binding transcriptional regulator YhcF (GntR family)
MTQLLDDSALRVFTILCGYADFETGEAWPSQRRIATEGAMGRSTVQRALDSLKAVGAIEEVSKGYNVAGERTENTHYLIRDRANVLATCGITEEQIAAITPTDVAWGIKALADVDVPIVCPSEMSKHLSERGNSPTYAIVVGLLLARIEGVALLGESGVALSEESGVAVSGESGVAVSGESLTNQGTHKSTKQITNQITEQKGQDLDSSTLSASTSLGNASDEVSSKGVESSSSPASDYVWSKPAVLYRGKPIPSVVVDALVGQLPRLESTSSVSLDYDNADEKVVEWLMDSGITVYPPTAELQLV